jgi:hypothetical protein
MGISEKERYRNTDLLGKANKGASKLKLHQCSRKGQMHSK